MKHLVEVSQRVYNQFLATFEGPKKVDYIGGGEFLIYSEGETIAWRDSSNFMILNLYDDAA